MRRGTAALLLWSTHSVGVSSFAFRAPTIPTHLSRRTLRQDVTQLSAKVDDAIPDDEALEIAKTILAQQTSVPKTGSIFSLTTALFLGGLAFDAYSEPSDSSRWERGSKGINVAFQSNAYTRSLYKGMVEVTVTNATDLPDEEDGTERLLSGKGVDPYLLVALVEGRDEERVTEIEKKGMSEGVLGLSSSSHVGRSSTVWSNIDEKKATKRAKKQKTEIENYFVESKWGIGGGTGGQAYWSPNEKPFYLYASEPAATKIVLSVVDEDLVGDDGVVGSATRKLSDLLPIAGAADPVTAAKNLILAKLKRGEAVDTSPEGISKNLVQGWEGVIQLQNKPKKLDKGGQVAMGAAAGAMVAGPVGAAVGGLMGNLMEGKVRGEVGVKFRYLPLPAVTKKQTRYEVKGGLPGVDWGQLYKLHMNKLRSSSGSTQNNGDLDPDIVGDDLEFCAFVSQDETGCSCGIYRSLEKKLIAVSFRGTCELVDLLTDASIIQTSWVDGEDSEVDETAKVHIGFRKSLNSVSRRVKELILGAVKPGDDLSQYDLLVTGHSLGGALATLFATDVAEYGVDAGRSLPQLAPSDQWWESLASAFSKKIIKKDVPPPRPKSLRLYSFGSPRVGNDAFVAKFDSLQGNGINEAYRVVNGADVVARLPRTVNALMFGSVGYDHCGGTALVCLPKTANKEQKNEKDSDGEEPPLWVEGESDDNLCPVRDGTPLSSPLASGMLLGDIYAAVKDAAEQVSSETPDGKKDQTVTARMKGLDFGKLAETVSGRLQSVTATDVTSIFGIDKQYADREAKIMKSVMSGEALSNHMEDQYYGAMGRACGFTALVGEEIISYE